MRERVIASRNVRDDGGDSRLVHARGGAAARAGDGHCGRRATRAIRVAEAQQLLDDTSRFRRVWLAQSTHTGRWREALERSAFTPKLMTYAPSGGGWWPHRRTDCPNRSAASGTGTTATPGSGTPRSRSARCFAWGSWRRPSHSAAGWSTGSRRGPVARVDRWTSCTGTTVHPTSPKRSSSTGRATAARGRCGSATVRRTSCSWTSMARHWTASNSATSGAHHGSQGLARAARHR